MKRRPREREASEVPADIAGGPEVRRWADPEALAALALMESAPTSVRKSDVGRDAVWSAMLSARYRWNEARDRWAADSVLSYREGVEMVPFQGPFWGKAEG